MTDAITNSYAPNYKRWTLIVIVGFLVFRIIALILSPLNLHGDEAQYWSWAQTLDWGYFSKPPMIAWVIWASTSVFGDAEWAVRLSSPILHSVTAFVLFLLGRKLFDAQTGFWSAVIYLTLPAVWLSNGIVSTDVPLLLCWAVALLAWAHLRNDGGWGWAITLGAAFGLGILSKYAMLFMVPAVLALLVIDRPTRKALFSLRGIIAGIIAVLIMLPNIIWNAQNEFATLSHTAANANIQDDIFHPKELLEFWGSQFGVFGPLTLVALIWTFFMTRAREAKLLGLFVLAPLIVISIEALLSRANANWAVTAYIAACVIVAHCFVTARPNFLKSSIAVNCVLGIFMVIAALIPSFADNIGQANAFKRMRGWPATSAAIEKVLEEGNFDVVATDNRLVFYDLVYYRSNNQPPLKMWLNTVGINNHAEYTQALIPDSGRVLLVNYYEDYARKFRDDFKVLTPLPSITIDLGGGKDRTLKLWVAEGYRPTTTRIE